MLDWRAGREDGGEISFHINNCSFFKDHPYNCTQPIGFEKEVMNIMMGKWSRFASAEPRTLDCSLSQKDTGRDHSAAVELMFCMQKVPRSTPPPVY